MGHEGFNETGTGTENWAWCLVGAIDRNYPPLFAPYSRFGHSLPPLRMGTRVYCLPKSDDADSVYDMVVVLCRQHGRWISFLADPLWLYNWRAKRVFHPLVLKWMWWQNQGNIHYWQSRSKVNEVIATLKKYRPITTVRLQYSPTSTHKSILHAQPSDRYFYARSRLSALVIGAFVFCCATTIACSLFQWAWLFSDLHVLSPWWGRTFGPAYRFIHSKFDPIVLGIISLALSAIIGTLLQLEIEGRRVFDVSRFSVSLHCSNLHWQGYGWIALSLLLPIPMFLALHATGILSNVFDGWDVAEGIGYLVSAFVIFICISPVLLAVFPGPFRDAARKTVLNTLHSSFLYRLFRFSRFS